MTTRPLAMPTLNQLPDPTDMMGGVGNPTAMMARSPKEIQDLLNPKGLAPRKVQVSAQAGNAIKQAQLQETAILDQAKAQGVALGKQQRALGKQQADLLQAQEKSSTARVTAYNREQARIAKEREKAEKVRDKKLKEKATEQGGVLGAGADGTFVLDKAVEALVTSPTWTSIVSNQRREVETETILQAWKQRFVEQGFTDAERIDAELQRARRKIQQDTKAYTEKMKDDDIDPLDGVTAIIKGGNSLLRGVAVMTGWNTMAKSLAQDGEQIRKTYSDTMLLDQANFAFQRQQSKAELGELADDASLMDKGLHVATDFGKGAKDVWDAESLYTTIVDLAGNLPYGAGVGGVATKSLNLAIAQLPKQALGSFIGTQATKAAVGELALGTATMGGMAGSGIMAMTDAAGGAYDAVSSTDVPKLKSNYIKNYGEANWKALVARNDNDLVRVRDELAMQAGRTAGAWGFTTGAVTGMFGLEKALVGMAYKGAGAHAGKRLLTVGANSVSESLEEGFTQMSQNAGATNFTGVNILDDVGATAALGAIGGTAMSGTSQAAAGIADSLQGSDVSNGTSPFDPTELDPTQYVTEGTLDLAKFKAPIQKNFDAIYKTHTENGFGDVQAQQLQQQAYDDYLDKDVIWATMTPQQRTEFRDYMKLEFGTNSNSYADYTPTAEEVAYHSGEITNVDATNNVDLMNAFRVKHNLPLTDTATQPIEYYKSMGAILDGLHTEPSNVNTRQRQLQMMQLHKQHVLTDQDLTRPQSAAITLFMFNNANAGSQRLTDEQQAQVDSIQTRVATVAETIDETQTEQTQTGQTQTPTTLQPNRQRTESGQENVGGESATRNGSESETSTTQQSTQGLEEVDTAPSGGDNPQGTRDGSTREDLIPSGGENITSKSSGDVIENRSGTREVSEVGYTGNPPTSQGLGRTATQDASPRPTKETRQPIGQADSETTQSPEGSGVPRTTQTTRSTNNQRNEATAETASRVAPAIAPNVTTELATQAYKNLSKVEKTQIKRISGTADPVQTLVEILAQPQSELTKRLATTVNKNTQAQTQRAVHKARDYVMAPDRVVDVMLGEQQFNSANGELIPTIEVALLADTSILTARVVSVIGSKARYIYGGKRFPMTPYVATAKLLADVAGVPTELLPSILNAKLHAVGKPPLKQATLDNIQQALKVLRERDVIPQDVHTRPPTLSNQVELDGVLRAISSMEPSISDAVTKFSKKITGATSLGAKAITLQTLLRMESQGIELAEFVQSRIKNTTTAIAVLQAKDAVLDMFTSAEYRNFLDTETWIQTAPKAEYEALVTDILVRMNRDINSPLTKNKGSIFKATEDITGVNVITLVKGKTYSKGIDLALVSGFIADSIYDISTLGDSYTSDILQARAGINDSGEYILKKTAAKKVTALATAIRAEIITERAKNRTPESTVITETTNAEPPNQQDDSGGETVSQAYPLQLSTTPPITRRTRESKSTPLPEVIEMGYIKEVEVAILDTIPEDADFVDIVTQLATELNLTFEDVLDYISSSTPSEFSPVMASVDAVLTHIDTLITLSNEVQQNDLQTPTQTTSQVNQPETPQSPNTDSQDRMGGVRRKSINPRESNDSDGSGFQSGSETVVRQDQEPRQPDSETLGQSERLVVANPTTRGTGVKTGRPTNAQKQQRAAVANELTDVEAVTALEVAMDSVAMSPRHRQIISETVTDIADRNKVSEGVASKMLIVETNVGLQSKKAAKDNLTALVPELKSRKSGLRQSLENLLKGLRKGVLNSMAFVSISLATMFGSTLMIPNTVEAAVDLTPKNGEVVMTSKAKATLDHVLDTNDNVGQPFIIADKKAGMLYLHNEKGVMVNSTPALYGRALTDATDVDGGTPAGRFETRQQSGKQVYDVGVSGDVYAIHKVITGNGQNRQARLDSPTATDNRISAGCINVPSEFYGNHLDGDLNAVVYILPEEATASTSTYSSTTTTQATKTQPQITTSVTMDKSTTQPVVISEGALAQAMAHTAPPVAKALAPVLVEGTTPSEQVAFVEPIVLDGVSVDSMIVPFGQHTVAELQADGAFDTAPITETQGGIGLGEIAIVLAGLFGLGANDRNNRGGVGRDKRDSYRKRSQDNKETVDTHHTTEPDTPKVRVQDVGIYEKANHKDWLTFVNNSHLTTDTNGTNTSLEGLGDALVGMERALHDALTDNSYGEAQSGVYESRRNWKSTNIHDGERTGISAKLMNFAAGATQNFDNLMNDQNIASFGHEADSSIPTKMLAQVGAKTSGAYSYIHKQFVEPFITDTLVLAGKLRTDVDSLQTDIGNLANVNHILQEGAQALFTSKQNLIDEKRIQLASVNAEIARTPEGATIRPTLVNTATALENEIVTLAVTLQDTMDVYEGETTWTDVPNVKMPGGYTKQMAETVKTDLEAQYADSFAEVMDLATDVTKKFQGIRRFATTSGVFSNADLRTFSELGFTAYVPLYAPQKDPTLVDDSDTYVTESIMDTLLQEIPVSQAKAMGLTKDLSRYHREGASTPAADATTNLKVFAMNMAGRVGQQGFTETVQQLYEGTVGQPISTVDISTNESLLGELNGAEPTGKLPGLIRIHPGQTKYLPAELREVRPIVAKGYNSSGEVTTFNYYFTDPAIRTEIYSNTDIQRSLGGTVGRNFAPITRWAARMMTVWKPAWNIYNMARDIPERISIMMMRPVKDSSGELIPKAKVLLAYQKALYRLVSQGQGDIYRYLTKRETKTPIQIALHSAVTDGAINLMTTQTDKHSIMAELSKSDTEKLGGHVSTLLGKGINKAGLRTLKQGGNSIADLYVIAFTELPQVTVALAASMAYSDLGVNSQESANRVRDQYDPMRADNSFISTAGNLYPFIRSTLSGHYNLWRTLTEYWGKDEWKGTSTFLAMGILGSVAIFAMAAGMLGDDDDGTPKWAQMPTGDLMKGIPISDNEDGVWTAPVGFGLTKVMWASGVNIMKTLSGYQKPIDAVANMAKLAVDNTSPLNITGGASAKDNELGATIISMAPLLFLPIVESATNIRAFGGTNIVGRKAPSDQWASDQDDFTVPETYKKWASSIRETIGVDVHPKKIRHMVESYAYGPLKAIPKSVLADKADKTLGLDPTKGEDVGALLTALGADVGYQPNALSDNTMTWRMNDLRSVIHKKTGVGETHSTPEYKTYKIPAKVDGGKAALLTKLKLEAAGVDVTTVEYVYNSMKFKDKSNPLRKRFRELATEYFTLRTKGEDNPQLREQVLDAWNALSQITSTYVAENNDAYLKLSVQY